MLRLLLDEARIALIALQFLTRVPIPARIGFHPAWLQASARHFPLVGALVGSIGALVLGGAAQLWPLPVAVGLSMAATVWLTGGFHEDGLADTCDGLGGAVSRERALVIMKDSRLGSYGALGLVLVLGLKAVTLHALAVHALWNALAATVFAHAGSRAATVMLLRALPYAGDAEHAKAKPMAQQLGGWGALVAAGWTGAVAWAVAAVLASAGASAPDLPASALTPAAAAAAGAAVRAATSGVMTIAASLAFAVVVATVCARWFRRRLGGYTGDTLGTTQQFTELAMLLGWLAALRAGAA